MARLFDGVDDQLNVDSTPITAAPFTMACWAKSSSAALLQHVLYIGDSASNIRAFRIGFAGSVVGDPIRFTVLASAGATNIDTTTGYSVNTWTHLCAVEASATDHRVFINGGSKGTSAVSRVPDSVDRVSVGRHAGSTPSGFLAGDVAEFAVWNIALSDNDVARLALALDARLIHPEALVLRVPILGGYSPEIDLVGDLSLTVTGAVASDHPRIFRPHGISIGKPPAAPTPFDKVPWQQGDSNLYFPIPRPIAY